MTRVKKVLKTIVSRAEAEEAFARYADADARQQQIAARMDVEITKIRSRYEADLSLLQESKQDSFESLQNYAENHRDDFGKRKSLEFAHGILGFRTGTPKLKTRKGFTWASVLELLKIKAADYVRTKEEPNKELLLANREKPELISLMPTIGIEVDQDETFFVEPKKETVEA